MAEQTSGAMLTRYGMREVSGLFTYEPGSTSAGLVVYVGGRIHKLTTQARTGKAGHVFVKRPGSPKDAAPTMIKAAVRVFERGHLPPPETLDACEPGELF